MGTYLGHETELFNSQVDSRALLEAAERRWDHDGGYTWQIPNSLAKKLTMELTGEPFSDIITDSTLLKEVKGDHLSLEPMIEPINDAQEDIAPSLLLPEGESNHISSKTLF